MADAYTVPAELGSAIGDVDAVKTAFHNIDTDGSGSIDATEVASLFADIGKPVSPPDLAKLMRDADVDGSGTVSFEEFCALIALKSELGAAVQAHSKLHKVQGAVGAHSYAEEEMVAFTEHINTCLRDDGYLNDNDVLPIGESGELFDAVNDGILLSKLINKAAADTIDERALNFPSGKPLNPWEKKENQNLCINAAKAIGCSIVNIHGDDLMRTREAQKEYLVLGMIWQIVKIQLLSAINLKEHPELVLLLNEGEELQDLMRLPPEEVLIRWFNYHLEKSGSSRRIANFSGDLKDSECYTLLLNQIDEDVCGLEALETDDKTARATSVINNAKELGVPAFVKPRDITSGNKRLNLAFCAQVFNTNHGLRLDADEAEKVKAEFESAGLLDDDEGDSREERVFRMWANSLGLDDYLHNLFESITEGNVMLSIIDKVQSGLVEWKKVNTTKMNRYKRLENMNYCIKLGAELKFSLVGIGGVDLLDKNKKLILAYVWQLMRLHVLSMLKELSGGEREIKDSEIVAWANEKVAEAGSERRIRSMKDSSISDGLFLLDLLGAIEPRVINEELVTSGETDDDKMMNAKYVISVARKLGCLVFLTWEDITEVKPKMMLTLLASIMKTGMSYSA